MIGTLVSQYRVVEKLGGGGMERSTDSQWLKSNPLWDPLRSEPRFQALLRRMGL
jgi:hypothetical protein